MTSSKIFCMISLVYFRYWSLGKEIRDDKNIVCPNFMRNPFLVSKLINVSVKVKNDLAEYITGLKNEDIHLNVSQLIRKYGYNVEEHYVTTKDGYILTLIRIPNEGPVVFLMHGLLMSADDWVIAGPESAIAYSLANEGYDVWMGNARGNKHSRRHVSLPPSSSEFWNFSWDEIGRYDLPAMIDYVLRKTYAIELYYVGHSQGCTAFLVMCSELPEYNHRISLMVAMAPPTAIPNIKSPFFNILKYLTFFRPDMAFSLAKLIGFYEFLPSNKLTKTIESYVCGTTQLAKIICSNCLFLICGFNEAQLNVTNLPVIFSHIPSGAATKQIEHFAQTISSGKFRKFDYGKTTNLKIYGTTEPPEYMLEKITAPIAIFYSDNDWLVSVKDVKNLFKRLPNVVDFYKIPLRNFNHVDYMYAKDLKQLVYKKLLSLLKQCWLEQRDPIEEGRD